MREPGVGRGSGLGAARLDVDLRHVRLVGGAMLAAGAVLSHLPAGVGVPCPLRTATGIPCPFCGSTTAIRAAMGGDLGRAVSVSPLGLLAAVTALALLVAGVAVPGRRRVRPPAAPFVALLAASWVFELVRFRVV